MAIFSNNELRRKAAIAAIDLFENSTKSTFNKFDLGVYDDKNHGMHVIQNCVTVIAGDRLVFVYDSFGNERAEKNE